MQRGYQRLLAAAAAGLSLLMAAGTAQALAQCCNGKKVKAALHCPVEQECPVLDKKTAPKVKVNNMAVYLCSPECAAKLTAHPEQYLKGTYVDVVSGKPFRVISTTPKEVRSGALFLFENPVTQAAFDRNPAKYIRL
jgi:YHS domain-containing protein